MSYFRIWLCPLSLLMLYPYITHKYDIICCTIVSMDISWLWQVTHTKRKQKKEKGNTTLFIYLITFGTSKAFICYLSLLFTSKISWDWHSLRLQVSFFLIMSSTFLYKACRISICLAIPNFVGSARPALITVTFSFWPIWHPSRCETHLLCLLLWPSSPPSDSSPSASS